MTPTPTPRAAPPTRRAARRRGHRHEATEAGAAEPVAMALLALPLLTLLGLIIIGGRISIAANTITTIAQNAARDASLARTPTAATHAATTAATAAIHTEQLHCTGGPHLRVDTSGFDAAAGTPAVVTVHVTCVLALRDFAIPGTPGHHTITARASSPLDPYRANP